MLVAVDGIKCPSATARAIFGSGFAGSQIILATCPLSALVRQACGWAKRLLYCLFLATNISAQALRLPMEGREQAAIAAVALKLRRICCLIHQHCRGDVFHRHT